MKGFILTLLSVFLFLGSILPSQAMQHRYTFIVQEAAYTRLCSTKNILTVNGQFPGPPIHIRQGDTTVIHVHNSAKENITIHWHEVLQPRNPWHGVLQPRNPWSDGPEYVTQCPIMPGKSFTQIIPLTEEIGTLWWHAHSDWSRATVHGLIIIYPRMGGGFPFPSPHAEVPLVLGEWWKSDVQAVLTEFKRSGAAPNLSDAFLINGQPGDRYPCSQPGTFKVTVEYGKTYLFRMVNAAMNNILFFSIAKHQLTIVGTDGSSTKPLKTDYVAISPGQTIDFLLEANQKPDHYYMAAKAYNSAPAIDFDKTNTTAIIEYQGNYTPSSPISFPTLPNYNDTKASTNFTFSLRSLSRRYEVPNDVDTKLFFTLSINLNPCEANNNCSGPQGERLATSINNITFDQPRIDILQAYYQSIRGVYGDNFPSFPPLKFNFTAENFTAALQRSTPGTRVRVLEYNSSVELVFQGTNLVAGIDHPMHLHGHSFYVVGWGFGNYDKEKGPLTYNLVDPPLMNTIAVPVSGWTAVRFKTTNPGVWLLHCHIERHITWGMEMTFIVKNGKLPQERMLPPPPNMPPC